ncbi:ATP-binding cassette subfamily F protein 3 [Natranaerovirga hydrolytica]|uniref:ATP-binding cassette subfamily F protein 3 n=1 Tax=Natranaerovirga hydrolytica TaxID=680378 RepID=A0A4R1MK19_9FIRM|nr:ABC-F family ATP-binding cassette domain-containing protein [Natranaerovirga hydrolytica]TCK92877.1 ATP-binding cassette subfamily F protein 3 [Natranaerovirga hydrolytica]
MILACKNISKSFADLQILNNVSFHIEKGDKVGLVGVNGAGKTTLFNIIARLSTPDAGQIITPHKVDIGYLSQEQDLASSNSIYDELLEAKKEILDLEESISALELKMKQASNEDLHTLMKEYAIQQETFEELNGYAYQSEIKGVLNGLGFSVADHDKKISTLSGGQKTRVSLAKLLLTKPDLLLLDEPTNHLDVNAIQWLEGYINNYSGTLIIISHDRYFLDKIVNKIIEIENTKCTVYNGNYSSYAHKKMVEREINYKNYINQQREIEKQEAVIEKLRAFNREKSIKRARSREKALNKVERIHKPQELNAKMDLELEPQQISGNDVLSINNLSKSFNETKVFENIALDIKRGEKIALIGNNGTGKTTLFKIILDELKADAGEVKLGSKVKCGYFDQEYTSLNENNNLIEEISDAYPTLKVGTIRNILAAFLFVGDDVFKKIAQLSGGEKGRLSLAKLMLSEANFLLLDEPTNHLDIYSKEILEDALKSYSGTAFFISHDRYFINKTANRILELTPTGMINYIGNYDYYLEKKEALSNVVNNQHGAVNKVTSSKNDWLKEKEEQAKQRKQQTELKNIELKIQTLENKIEAIDAKLCLEEVYTDHIQLKELNDEKSTLDNELIHLYELWEDLL